MVASDLYLVIGIGSDFLKYPDQKSNFLKNLRLKNKILKQQHYMYIAIFCIAKNFSGMGILMVDTFCEPTVHNLLSLSFECFEWRPSIGLGPQDGAGLGRGGLCRTAGRKRRLLRHNKLHRHTKPNLGQLSRGE